jgi:hypothetical protein
MGASYSHNAAAGAITSGTLIIPSSAVSLVVTSLRVHLGASTRSTSTYNVVFPSGGSNLGAGDYTGEEDFIYPIQQVRQDSDGLASVGATLAKNVSGNYTTIQFAGLPAVTTGLYFALSF